MSSRHHRSEGKDRHERSEASTSSQSGRNRHERTRSQDRANKKSSEGKAPMLIPEAPNLPTPGSTTISSLKSGSGHTAFKEQRQNIIDRMVDMRLMDWDVTKYSVDIGAAEKERRTTKTDIDETKREIEKLEKKLEALKNKDERLSARIEDCRDKAIDMEKRLKQETEKTKRTLDVLVISRDERKELDKRVEKDYGKAMKAREAAKRAGAAAIK